MNLLTNSRSSCYRTCRRKHFFRYERAIIPATHRSTMSRGILWHAMHEERNNHRDPWPVFQANAIVSGEDKERLARLFMGYQWFWESKPEGALDFVAVELEFDLPIHNPRTGEESKTWRQAGKIDGIVRLPDGRLAVLEYKTTSHSIEPDAPYWTRLRLDQQITSYYIAARKLGYDVQTILYDVTHIRATMRPYKATPPEKRKYTKAHVLYANQREEDESLDDFGERLTSDIVENPYGYYARCEVPRLDEDIAEFEEELWQQQADLTQTQAIGSWYRNTSACINNNASCEYLALCSQGSYRSLGEEVPEGYVKLDNINPELEGSLHANRNPSDAAASHEASASV